MKNLFRKYWLLTVAAVLLFASASSAQTVSMTITGVNPTGTSLGGVFTDPYQGTVNGTPATIVCDDWADETYLPESWQANANNLASAGVSLSTLTPVKWDPLLGGKTPGPDGTQQLYNEVAYLVTELLATNDPTKQADISYALWQLTCSAPVATVGNLCSKSDLPFSKLTGADLTNATNYLNDALNITFTPGEYSNFTIYTPVAGSGTNGTTPQEFIVLTPESSTVVMVGADMLGLLALAFFFRRRLVQPLN